MRCLVVLIFLSSVVVCVSAVSKHQADVEDNDFAEFEEFDEEDEVFVKDSTGDKPKQQQSPGDQKADSKREAENDDEEEAVVEDEEDSEFEHFQDEEEFEGFDQEKPSSKSKLETPDLKITKVPLHFSTSWESFYLEMLMVTGLIVYFVNFCVGRSKNQAIVDTWYSTHRQILEENFHLVGDDGNTEVEKPEFVKQSESVYLLWCSGRTSCEGMLVELRLLKRQDLVHIIAQKFKPATDQIVIKVFMNSDDMDSFVFAVCNKKSAAKLAKEMTDISTYCPEKKGVDKFGLPVTFSLFSEIGEATSAIMDSKVCAVINKYSEFIEYIHFSDQFSGPKGQDDSQVAKPSDVVKILMFVFNIPKTSKSSALDPLKDMKQLLHFIFYCTEKVKRFRLSKEAKTKAEKSRQKVEEAYLKTTHSQRMEAAQLKRDEKRRQQKEKILLEDDPDKQRKWEEKEYRREMKKRAPKIKQLKVKAL